MEICLNTEISLYVPLFLTVTGTCRYLYTEQPPLDLQCNPYPANVLILSCAVTYSRSELPVTLNWIHYPNSNTQTPLRISQTTSKYRVTPGSVLTGQTRSTLQINTLTDVDAGSYSCQAVFTNGSRTDESQRLNLFTRTVFTSQRLSSCSQFSGESTTQQKCALTGQVSSNPDNTAPTSSGGDNGGTGGAGGGVLGPQTPLILAVIGVVVFLVITTFILVCCCVIFQGCKHFD